MPKHRELLGKLLATTQHLLHDAEQYVQSAQADFENDIGWRHHHLLVKSNMSRLRRLLSECDPMCVEDGQCTGCAAK